ncbi:alpha/beta hydrolase [Subtercola vilae]|uniref:Alpha/beta fold hydrolase n=1 Tax=Subtercola vilae TaxID=2056433 RepID=A0A4T2C4Q1_9MICO|nr:alpha/beta fold hydrolase [Subtercola vilae]TIH37446.1 alpha/beta fold hydrolase [Subtercola vilae]
MSAPVVSARSAVSVQLPVTSWGDPRSERRILLVHGLTSAGAVWWRVASLLAAEGFFVEAPDLRGHGLAPRTLSYTLPEFSADLLRLAAPDARPYTLVIGHSLGGAITGHTLAGHPEWAVAALLLDPLFAAADDAVPGIAHDMSSALLSGTVADHLAQNPRWHAEDAHQKLIAARAISPFVVEHSLLDNVPWNVGAVVANTTRRMRILGADPAIEPPVFSEAEGLSLATANPAITFAVVEGAAHSIQRDDPARVVSEALALIAATS